ncbi:photosynthetic NDH subunit of subcomplex B 5, chloroplastic [Alnus glutinosa]|uniref:photosynthetic NDH subunit of subcomplex B 5, chloroplastic n=1 Tax=Alnus glutinosa TaxID=3517 RepID=UPI002D78AFA9|nr:photosynthetic NDH subunit of subcomplex B 5, chloroplastic [Alnus glutinosa]XP_062168517.1 photosynthetic NDH subunit of subcomplex B 5, chloroplastic [Alnus glutinosa]
MAVCSSLSVLSANSAPRVISNPLETRVSFLNLPKTLSPMPSKLCGNQWKNRRLTKLNRAGLSQIEPDLNEDPVDRWATNSVSPDDFKYGEYDGHHTYHEGEEKGTFWGLLAEEIAGVGPPTGFQGFISWLFLPAIAAGMFFQVPMVYLFIGAGLFTIVFTIIELDKPDQPHNFEPQIYNMERGARDKLIADYNTMSIWDFNEKYGDLWDFTVIKDDITKR